LLGAQASGDITVNARAITGTHALGSAVALAAGGVAAFNNQVSAGNIDVEALASDHGAGNAISQAVTVAAVVFGHGEVSVGSVTDKAVAKDSGPGSANAGALVLTGGATIQVSGNINITASALNTGGHGGTGMGAHALANLQTSGLRSGINAQITGDLNITANAVNLGSGKVLAKGFINTHGLATLDVHDVAIDVAALNEGNGSGGANASAHFSASPALHLTMHGLKLHASASSHGGGGALASAGALIVQPTISIAGSIDITAFAHNGPGGAGGNQANAIVVLGLDATAGGATVGHVTVAATAINRANGNANAAAVTDMQVATGDKLTIGSLGDFASALTANGNAKALADVTLDPPSGRVEVMGNVIVEATASNLKGHGPGSIAASANAALSFPGVNSITVHGNLVVGAEAVNSGSGKIVSKAGVDFKSASNINLGGIEIFDTALNAGGSGANATAAFVETNTLTHLSIGSGGIDVFARASSLDGGEVFANALVDIRQHTITIGGDVRVTARATNSTGSSDVTTRALANLSLTAVSTVGNVEVAGDVAVNAVAFGRSSGNTIASALVDISASAGEGAGPGGNITLNSLRDTANATQSGGVAAQAHAITSINAGNSADILGDAGVNAVARKIGGSASDSTGALAEAHLNFKGAKTVTVGGIAGANAAAFNGSASNAPGGVNAQGRINFGSASNIDLGGVAIHVVADQLSEVGGFGANATASFVLTNPAVNLSIGSEGIEVRAAAIGDDGGAAVANALVDVVQDNLAINGNVEVSAVALNGTVGSGGGRAEANANLQLTATAGNVALLGNADVAAFASNAGSGNAVANAITGITANVSVLTFSLHDRAGALNLGSGTAHANAALSVFAQHPASILGEAHVSAFASNLGGFTGPGIGASADAALNFHNAQTVTVQGIAGATASAINRGQGSVNAHAGMGFGSAASINLGGVRISVAAANLGTGAGGPGAHANAAFTMTNNSVHLTIGSEGIDVGAFAVSVGQGNASATALIDIAQNGLVILGNVEAVAFAINGGPLGSGGGNAQANANVTLHADSGSALVVGNVAVAAFALDAGAGNAVAQGRVDISASAGEGSGGRQVTIGALHDRALAADSGAGSANAQAHAYLQANTVAINGSADISASADNRGAAGGNNNLAASANAELGFGSEPGHVNVQVAGSIEIRASASNTGSGKVNAHGALEFDDATTLAANDIIIAVAALNKGTAGTGGATANASFIASHGQHLAINGLNLQAIASSHGGQGATANANAQITQIAISIAGDITLNAAAFNGSGGEGDAKAHANLGLLASLGAVSVGGIDVEARASGGGSLGAQASAVVGITASAGEGAGVTLGGLFDGAAARSFGSGPAFANAVATIDPPAVVHIQGNASVFASATNLGTGRTGATDAFAHAQLNLGGGTTLTVDGNAVVGAFATNFGLGGAAASGSIAIGAGGIIHLGGVQIDVAALDLGTDFGRPGPKPGAHAVARFLDTGGGAGLTVGADGINVQALASSARARGALASAAVVVHQAEVTVLGGVTVSANAINGLGVIEEGVPMRAPPPPAPGGATARALLTLEADSGSITVDGQVDVKAQAFDDSGAGAAIASALTNTIASAGEGVTGGVTLGRLTDVASAFNAGGEFARAKALANIDPPGSVHILGNASVAAHALNSGTGSGGVGASAVARLNFVNFDTINVEGNAVASAAATNFHGGGVNANGSIGFGGAGNVHLGGVKVLVDAFNSGTGHSGANAMATFVENNTAVHLTIGTGGVEVRAAAGSTGGGGALAQSLVDIVQNSVVIGGGVEVRAFAGNNTGGTGGARSITNLTLTATHGGVTVGGPAIATAFAVDFGAGNAFASAQEHITAGGGGGNVTVGPLIDSATAVNYGGGYAKAVGAANVVASGAIHVEGTAAVTVSAFKGPGAGGGIGASANGQLNFAGANTVTVDSAAVVLSRATNSGASGVKAHGAINFGVARNINLGGAEVDVFARDKSTAHTGSAAKASAAFVQNNGAVHLTIGSSGLLVRAVASSQGHAGASANALGDIQQGNISIAGGVDVSAVATGGPNVGQKTKAKANLVLDATTGNVAVGGDILASAQANSNGIHGALGSALAGLTAAHKVSVGGNLGARATASTHALGNVTLASSVKANAELAVHAGSSAHFGGTVGVTAQENARLTPIGRAIAKADIQANPGAITFNDDVLVQANALGGAGAGNVRAVASLDAVAGNKISLANNAGLTVNAHAVSSGTQAVTAIAQGMLQANAIQQTAANGQGNIAVSASAVGMGNGIDDAMAVALFSANADVGGILLQNNVDIHASAVDPGAGNMLAFAYGNLTANSGITVDGNIALAADLTGNGLGAGSFHLASLGVPVKLYSRFGTASLTVDANHGNVALDGVSVLASANLTATGTPHGGHVRPARPAPGRLLMSPPEPGICSSAGLSISARMPRIWPMAQHRSPMAISRPRPGAMSSSTTPC